MGISKILDKKIPIVLPEDAEGISCMKGSSDCMFLTQDGGCCAEWCILEELPKIATMSKELTCSICGETKKEFSTFSGVSSFICDECAEKIQKTIKDTKCPICGAEIEPGIYICGSCANRIRNKLNES